MIAGLENATSGDILIAGKRVNELPARERNVAMTFQFYALYPSLTVEENLAYPLHADGLGARRRSPRASRRSARVLDLEGILKRRPHQLGEGEKQRVAVGRSIVRQPTCFLFDEPLSRLDIQLRQQMRTQIKEVLERLDKPTVIVTHDQIEALTMADRIAVMRDGRIEQVATPARPVRPYPTNIFVAGFIGTPQMNLLPATLEATAEEADATARARFALLGEQFSAPVEAAVRRLAPGANVTLGVRPRSFELAPPEAADVVHASIDLIEPMGAEMLVHLLRQGRTCAACWPTPRGCSSARRSACGASRTSFTCSTRRGAWCDEQRRGFSGRQARTLEYPIVGASILALVLIFQPFALGLFSIGAAAIVAVGLLFNLVPLCQPGVRVALAGGGADRHHRHFRHRHRPRARCRRAVRVLHLACRLSAARTPRRAQAGKGFTCRPHRSAVPA